MKKYIITTIYWFFNLFILPKLTTMLGIALWALNYSDQGMWFVGSLVFGLISGLIVTAKYHNWESK